MIESAGIAAAVLAIGYLLYNQIEVLQRLFIQPALIAGFILLLPGPYLWNLIPEQYYTDWSQWPGLLITFLFIFLIFSQPPASNQNFAYPVLQQGIVVWIIAIGQICVGLVVVIFTGSDPLFAHVIEIGWMGGHGSAAAYLAAVEDLSKTAGDLAMISATAGLLFGSLSGMILIQLMKNKPANVASEDTLNLHQNKEEGFEKDLILLVLAAGVTIWLAVLSRDFASKATELDFVNKLPLFFIALLIAFLIRTILIKFKLFRPRTVNLAKAMNSIILDFLIVSAIATLNLPVALEHLDQLAYLTLAASVWVLVVFFFVSKLLPGSIRDDIRIINYGMSTGITALGLMLLKARNKNLPVEPVTVYGLAAPLSAPFIGGGIISLLLPIINHEKGPIFLVIALLPVILTLFLLGLLIKKKINPD